MGATWLARKVDAGLDTINRVRKLNQAFLDRTAPQRFVFHHVPKCGGTSVARALRRRYLTSQATVRPEPSFQAFKAFTGRTDTEQMLTDVSDLRQQMMLYLLYDDIRCISLHVPFSHVAYEHFGERYKFVTLLREPVSRFISHYNWSSRGAGEHGQISEDFDTFLYTQRARRMGAEFVEMFSDQFGQEDIRTPEAISTAVTNLRRFDLVGRLDDLEGFSMGLREILGIRIRIGHENRTGLATATVSASNLTPSQRRAVEEVCAPDIAVWNAIFGGD
ncbi:sulfotransferase family 2 domain-containing protein [Sulfitobacter sp. 916]|uniref:sulfotransferase family 2 domain-containing protein n=1 Tax=Sulfitobacter sp. 916 TaxID=3368559 RepID=UPI0037465EB7